MAGTVRRARSGVGVSTLHALLPPLPRVRVVAGYARWLARGRRLPDVGGGRTGLLHALFDFAGDAVPVAALRHHMHAADAGTGAWLAADPAFVQSEATGARLMACPLADLAADEADQLAGALRPLFGDAGTPLEVDTAQAWCARLPGEAPALRFVAPADALGANLLDCLPDGTAGRVWRRLFTEAQVILHNHPVNAARVAAGRRPVNALWLWGAGALPGSVATQVARVASADDALLGLAKLAHAASAPVDTTALAGDGDVLLDLDSSDAWNALPAWLDAFNTALRTGRFRALHLMFAGGEQYRVRRIDRLRFWIRG